MYLSSWRSESSRVFGARLVDGTASLRNSEAFATGEPEVLLVSPEELLNGDVVSVNIDLAPEESVRCVVEIAGAAPFTIVDGDRRYLADIVKFVGDAAETWNSLFGGWTAARTAIAA